MHASSPTREAPSLTSTSTSTPDVAMDAQQAPSPVSPESPASSVAVDLLAASAARRIAQVINDFKRELDQRDGTWAHVSGSLELALKATNAPQTIVLTITPDEDGDEYPVTVHTALKQPEVITIVGNDDHDDDNDNDDDDDGDDNDNTAAQPALQSTRRVSDAELEKDIVSRKKRKLDQGDEETNKRQRQHASQDEGDGEDIMPLITKGDLDDLLVKLRNDIQEDTTEAVNHVQRLLRRFKEEWHEQIKRESERSQTQEPGRPFRSSLSTAGPGLGDPPPSPGIDHDDANASTFEIIRREAGLISRQIKWVENCRRVANDVHFDREETWRTTSAAFHEQQRQDREQFQNRMIHDSTVQAQILGHILNEVKAIGLYAQNMKWETPSYLNNTPHASPQVPTPPAFPPQQAPPPFPTQAARVPSGGPRQPAQSQHFAWRTGRGPGTHNG